MSLPSETKFVNFLILKFVILQFINVTLFSWNESLRKAENVYIFTRKWDPQVLKCVKYNDTQVLFHSSEKAIN